MYTLIQFFLIIIESLQNLEIFVNNLNALKFY